MVPGVFLIAATLGSTHLALATEQPATQSPATGGLHGGPLRIMPLGDSITVGFTDNPRWTHPFEFGYRSGLYRRLKEAGYDFVFVGSSKEPFTNPRRFADPTHGGTVSPTLDLRTLNQNGRHGHGGFGIDGIQKFAPEWIKKEQPDLILLLIDINKMSPSARLTCTHIFSPIPRIRVPLMPRDCPTGVITQPTRCMTRWQSVGSRGLNCFESRRNPDDPA
jgi:hypothetical protein